MKDSILTFGASSSGNSINAQLAKYAANELDDVNVNFIDLNDFDMPIYSIDRENDSGIPPHAVEFKKMIRESNAIIISFAEHNGSYTAAFKNLMDWTSRIEGKLWESKPMLLLSASPGGRGGATVLQSALTYFPYMGAHIVDSLSISRFYQNFSEGGMTNSELKALLKSKIEKLQKIIKS